MPQDYTQAAYWFRKAANQGDAYAQYNLGFLYANGQGVPRNYVIASALYDLAVTNGYQTAAANRDRIAQQLSPADLNAARQLAHTMEQEDQVTGPINQFLASYP